MPSDTEGIAALFSMYNDDDEEEEEADEPNPPSPAPPTASAPDPCGVSSPPPSQAEGEGPDPSQVPPSPPRTDESTSRKTLASSHPSPALPPLPSHRSSSPFAASSSPSPLRPASTAPPADLPRPQRRGALAIVDYAHDEMAMSPEQEDGEIMSGAHRFGSDVQASKGNLEERTLPGTVQIMLQNSQAEISQQSDAPEQNLIGTDTAMEVSKAEIEDARMEEAPDISTIGENDDPLSRFLGSPVTKKCSAALQQKFNKFLAYQRVGKSFNAEVRNRKDYRNPDFLQHAVRYQEIDQIGSCFSKDVFDPYGYDKSDYYDEIEADMKRELERKEQEKKKNPKVEFIAGGLQAPIGASIPKIPALAGTTAAQIPTEGVQKETTRPNKKSKWDKADGDIKNPSVPSGHDNLSATVSAALANVGAGYAAFAQQKRREAEDKRTSDYKNDDEAIRSAILHLARY